VHRSCVFDVDVFIRSHDSGVRGEDLERRTFAVSTAQTPQ